MSASVYYLFDEVSREQMGPYTEAECKSIISGYSAEDLKNKKIWMGEWDNWRPLMEYLKPQAPAAQILKLGSETDIGSASSEIKNVDLVHEHQRNHPRLAYRIPCTISSGVHKVQTYSHDISLGGVQLEDALPSSLLQKKCVLTISEPDGTDFIQMTLNLTARKEPKYFYFSEFAPSDMVKLELWLARLSKHTIKRPKFKS